MRPVLNLTSLVLLAALCAGVAVSASVITPTAVGEIRLARHAASQDASRVPATAAGLGSQSFDWAGYVVTVSRSTSVTGQWSVPQVSATSGLTASALWIGIDGVRNHHLIQTGTEQDSVNGRTEYYAWWEILPAAAVRVAAFSVRPGDRMSATIARVSAGLWRITISDARGGTFSTERAYGGSGTSAEWILEAPFLGRRQAQLAHLGTTGFDHATLNGANPGFTLADEVTLVQNNMAAATPSGPDSDRDGFRLGQGAIGPAPPHS